MAIARILILEDEVVVGKDLKSLLINNNFEVVGIATTEEESYKLAMKFKPDLVLIDVHLKNGDSGIEAFKKIKAAVNIPGIFITAFSDTDILDAAAFTNPQSYLIKPYQEKQLIVTIKMVLYKTKIEKKLQEQEVWLSSSFKNMATGVITCNNEGNVKYINPFAQDLINQSDDEVVGKPLRDSLNIVCQNQPGGFDKCIQDILLTSSDSKSPKEYSLVVDENTTLDISINGSEIFDASDVRLGFVLEFQDITERKRRTLALKKLKEELEEKVIERTSDLESANQELESQKDELSTQSSHLRKANSDLNQAFTDQQKSIEKIKFLNRALRFAVPEALIITDNIGRIEYVNPAFEVVTGLQSNGVIDQKIPYLHKNLFNAKAGSKEQLTEHRSNLLKKIGSDKSMFKNLVFGIDHKFSEVYFEEMLKEFDQKKPWVKDVQNERKNGEIYSEHNTIKQVFNTDGEIENFLIIKDDISNEKELEQQLIHSQKIEMLSRITAGISHDFNNILNIILSHADYLKSECETETNKASLEAITSSVDRGAKLIRNLLSLGREQESFKESIALNKTLKSTLKLIKNIFNTEHEIKTDFSRGQHHIYGDTSHIEHVVTNICINAKDAMAEGGTLTISTKEVNFQNEIILTNTTLPAGKYILVSFTDTGKGVSQQDMLHIFDPFFSTKISKKGSGLGLSMVSRIVTDHDGGISVQSTPGKGTTFNLYFPISDPNQTKTKEVNLHTKTQPLKPLNVLIVDDEDEVITILVNRFEKHRLTCQRAFNGQEALEIFKAKRDKLDLIISDIVMPEMNGMTLLKKVKKIDSTFPVLIMTGSPITRADKDYLEEHSVDLLTKPIEFKKLLSKISSLNIQPKAEKIEKLSKKKHDNSFNVQNSATDQKLEFLHDPPRIILPQYLSNQKISQLEVSIEEFFINLDSERVSVNMLEMEEFTLPFEKILLRMIVLAKKYNKKITFKAAETLISVIKEHGYSVEFN